MSPSLDNERGREATTTRVVVYNRSYSNHKHDYALGRHTPLDSESFTIITRYIGEYQETDYVNSRLDECLFNRVRLEASSNCTVVVRWKLVQVGYSLEGLEKGWDRVLSDEQLLLRLANYCFLRSLSRLLLLLPRNGVDIALIETIRL